MQATVNSDGSIDFSWQNDQPETYQRIRIYRAEEDQWQRVYRSDYLQNATSLHVPFADLDALEQGQTYAWQTRSFDTSDFTTYGVEARSDYKEFTYNPDPQSMGNRITWSILLKHNDSMFAGFGVREGSMEHVQSARLCDNNGTEIHAFSEDERYDIGSSTYTDHGWWAELGQEMTSGEHRVQVIFDDGYSENATCEWYPAEVEVQPVSGLSENVYPNGAVSFSWNTADLDPELLHQVVVDSPDGQKRYYRSGQQADNENVLASAWDLRGLEFGQEYQWRIRTYAPSGSTRCYSQPKSFVYDPYGLAELTNTELAQAIEALQFLSGVQIDDPLITYDHDGDGLLELEDAVRFLQKAVGE
jgi:hypothetical protein